MLAVKGYIDSGRFTPTDGAKLPVYANAVLVIENDSPVKEKNSRKEWLDQLRQARQLAKADPLPDFVVRQPMREPHGLAD